MSQYRWDFKFLLGYYPLILRGLWDALLLAASVFVLSMALGVVIGAARSSSRAALRYSAGMFIEFFRNIPALVQVFWFFYALPVLTGLQTGPFTAAATALTCYSAAYLAEIFRSGIQSIERGQWEASRSIGMSYAQQMRYVVLPQAIRRIIPALTNQAIEIVKLTTVASTIAYGEVLYYAKLLSAQEFRPLEAYTAAAGSLIGVLLVMSYASTRIERRLRRDRALG